MDYSLIFIGILVLLMGLEFCLWKKSKIKIAVVQIINNAEYTETIKKYVERTHADWYIFDEEISEENLNWELDELEKHYNRVVVWV